MALPPKYPYGSKVSPVGSKQKSKGPRGSDWHDLLEVASNMLDNSTFDPSLEQWTTTQVFVDELSDAIEEIKHSINEREHPTTAKRVTKKVKRREKLPPPDNVKRIVL